MAFRLFCWSLAGALVLTANTVSYRAGVDWNIGGAISLTAGMLLGLPLGATQIIKRCLGQ